MRENFETLDSEHVQPSPRAELLPPSVYPPSLQVSAFKQDAPQRTGDLKQELLMGPWAPGRSGQGLAQRPGKDLGQGLGQGFFLSFSLAFLASWVLWPRAIRDSAIGAMSSSKPDVI